MTDRIALDDMTSDQLDALYDERDALNEQVDRGRKWGDIWIERNATLTSRVDDANARAEQAEADRDRAQQAACRTAENLRHTEARIVKAEAAIERLRALHHEWKRNETDPGPGYCAHCEKGDDVIPWPCLTLATLDEPQQPTSAKTDDPRCVCGDQIQLRDEIDPNSWVHGPGSDTPCWNARPTQQPTA